MSKQRIPTVGWRAQFLVERPVVDWGHPSGHCGLQTGPYMQYRGVGTQLMNLRHACSAASSIQDSTTWIAPKRITLLCLLSSRSMHAVQVYSRVESSGEEGK